MFVVENLPRRKMKQCSICYDPFPRLISLECGHEFCENCVDSILNHSCSLKCALCRKHSYNIEHKKLNTKIFMVQLFGPSYIDWEMLNKKYPIYSALRVFYWYYGHRYPYTYHAPVFRSYKCKI